MYFNVSRNTYLYQIIRCICRYTYTYIAIIHVYIYIHTHYIHDYSWATFLFQAPTHQIDLGGGRQGMRCIHRVPEFKGPRGKQSWVPRTILLRICSRYTCSLLKGSLGEKLPLPSRGRYEVVVKSGEETRQ